MGEQSASQAQSQIQTAKTIWRRHRRTSFIITFCVLTAVMLYSALMKPVYKVATSVLIENKANTVLSNEEKVIDYSRDLALAQKALALSRPVFERAAELAHIPEWNLPDYDIDPLSPYSEWVASAKIEGQLLTLEVLNTDPQRAVTLANAWMIAFVEEMGRRHSSASAYASGFLDDRIPALKSDWIARQNALQAFLVETNFDPKENEYHPIYKQYIDLNSKITQSRIDLAALKSEAAAWESAKAHPEVLLQLPRARADANIIAYEKLIQDKHHETIELRQNFDIHGDKVERAEAALKAMQTLNRQEVQNVGEQLKLEIQIQEKALAEMETLLDVFKAEYLKVKSNEARYQTLAFEVQLAQTQYEELLKRQRDASVEGNANFSYALPWEHADFPRKKYRPNWPLNLAIALFLSGFLSVSVAGVRELLNDRVRTAAELRQLGHPPAAEIPLVRKCKRHELLSLISARPEAPAAHALRMLRSNLAATHLWSAPRKSFVVMVTSAGHGEGKSFVAANLALIFAKTAAANSGRVLLIDTDLNNPTLTYEMNKAGQLGVGTLHDQPLMLEELARTTGTSGLDFVAAGPTVKNSGAVIESSAFAHFLQQARKQYSVIVIDSPPTFCGSILLEKCDSVLAIVRSEQTRITDLERLATAFSKFNNVSYVLNSVRAMNSETTPAPMSAPALKDVVADSLYEAMDPRKLLAHKKQLT